MGGSIPTWTTDATRWAEIRPMSGKELSTAQQVSPRVSHKIVLRHFPGLDSTYRFLWGNRVFKMISDLNLSEIGKMDVCIAEELSQIIDQYVFIVDDDTTPDYLIDATGAFLVE